MVKIAISSISALRGDQRDQGSAGAEDQLQRQLRRQSLRPYPPWFAAERHLDLPSEELTSRCEWTVRNYDPCISCATHFLNMRVLRT